MKKIPTIFERNWASTPALVVDKVTPGCEWVLAGEGIATRKLDGTCCMVRDGKLYKRREIKAAKLEQIPIGFELSETDFPTGVSVGWMPVGEGPEDRWHREALLLLEVKRDNTYELVGPKVQGNPEHWDKHELIPHNYLSLRMHVNDRTFDGLKTWLTNQDIEGLVFKHGDGRMAKIKKKDFGLPRVPK